MSVFVAKNIENKNFSPNNNKNQIKSKLKNFFSKALIPALLLSPLWPSYSQSTDKEQIIKPSSVPIKVQNNVSDTLLITIPTQNLDKTASQNLAQDSIFITIPPFLDPYGLDTINIDVNENISLKIFNENTPLSILAKTARFSPSSSFVSTNQSLVNTLNNSGIGWYLNGSGLYLYFPDTLLAKGIENFNSFPKPHRLNEKTVFRVVDPSRVNLNLNFPLNSNLYLTVSGGQVLANDLIVTALKDTIEDTEKTSFVFKQRTISLTVLGTDLESNYNFENNSILNLKGGFVIIPQTLLGLNFSYFQSFSLAEDFAMALSAIYNQNIYKSEQNFLFDSNISFLFRPLIFRLGLVFTEKLYPPFGFMDPNSPSAKSKYYSYGGSIIFASRPNLEIVGGMNVYTNDKSNVYTAYFNINLVKLIFSINFSWVNAENPFKKVEDSKDPLNMYKFSKGTSVYFPLPVPIFFSVTYNF